MRTYESLTLNDSPQPVDLIFVMAGRERKRCGLERYRTGIDLSGASCILSSFAPAHSWTGRYSEMQLGRAISSATVVS